MLSELTREPPVGSSDSDSYHDIILSQPKGSEQKIKELEEERDGLQKNMISLTSRLAQVSNFISDQYNYILCPDRIPHESNNDRSRNGQK